MKKYCLLILLFFCNCFLFSAGNVFLTIKDLPGKNYSFVYTAETEDSDINKNLYPYNVNLFVCDGPENDYSQCLCVRFYYKTKTTVLEEYQKILRKFDKAPDYYELYDYYENRTKSEPINKRVDYEPSTHAVVTFYIAAGE